MGKWKPRGSYEERSAYLIEYVKSPFRYSCHLVVDSMSLRSHHPLALDWAKNSKASFLRVFSMIDLTVLIKPGAVRPLA